MNRQSDLFNFLRALAIGFGIISIGIAIAIVGYMVATKNQTVVQDRTVNPTTIQPSPTSTPLPGL